MTDTVARSHTRSTVINHLHRAAFPNTEAPKQLLMSIMPSQQPHSQLPPAAIGTKQTIQARSGTATFVPKGHTIKIINSYGAQVVAVWAFALHDAPTEEEMEEEREDMEQAESQVEAAVNNSHAKDSEEKVHASRTQDLPADPKNDVQTAGPEAEEPGEIEPVRVVENTREAEKNDAGDTDRQKDTLQDYGVKKGWAAYIPSVRGRSKQASASDGPQIIDSSAEKSFSTPRKTWTSYIPSVSAIKNGGPADNKEPRSWASYIPSGHGFSSYIPKDALHALSEIHKRDPNKSVAEQLYDFSKTPAGAASLSSKSPNTSPCLLINRTSCNGIRLCQLRICCVQCIQSVRYCKGR
jgi:hypothetical protein